MLGRRVHKYDGCIPRRDHVVRRERHRTRGRCIGTYRRRRWPERCGLRSFQGGVPKRSSYV